MAEKEKSLNRLFDFLKDPNDQLSSKRLIGLWAAFNATIYIWVMAFFKMLSAEIGLTAFMTMVAAGILGATLDHFDWSKKE